MVELLHSSLSVVMHIGVAVFLFIYLPFSMLWKLLRWALVSPWIKEDMRGKVVLITGASSGIGEQIAYEYARRGASMSLVARRLDALNSVAKNARECGAPDVLVTAADISKSNESKRVIQQAISHFGKLNHLVVNAGIWSSCLFEEITSINAFNQMMDVNFWGSIYPSYYAISHLKNSRGKIIVTASTAGRVPTARMTFYNASKAAVISFYETLRQELGSEVGITIANPGYVTSELTQGKGIQKNGNYEVNEEVRDVQIGPIPIGSSKHCAKKIVNAARRGDKYMTWPGWYRPLFFVMYFAPEVVDWLCRSFLVSKLGEDSSKTLSTKILNLRGAKKLLYPSSIRSSNIQYEVGDQYRGEKDGNGENVP